MVNICLYGRHSHRTPFSYPAYRKIFSDTFCYVSDYLKADILVVGFVLDIKENIDEVFEMLNKHPKLKVIVVSEEPLWDTMWSGEFRRKVNVYRSGNMSIPYYVINHFTSGVFNFNKFPYFLTTDDAWIVRYQHLSDKMAKLDIEDIKCNWENAPVRVALYAEKRPEEKFDIAFPEIDTVGLCRYRTECALNLSGSDSLIAGKGFGSASPRQALPDWHLDKIASISDRCQFISGLENTHYPQYITEKIFDAYLSCGVPLYYASPQHRIFDIVPSKSFVNLYNVDPSGVDNLVDLERVDINEYKMAHNSLWELFHDIEGYQEERFRVAREITAEVENILR